MSLRKAVNFKGVIADYWTIADFKWSGAQNQTGVLMALYANEATRLIDKAKEVNGKKNFDNALNAEGFIVDGEFTRDNLYLEIVKSKTRRVLKTPAKEATYDDEGVLISPAVEAVYDEIGMNKLVDAEAC